MDQCQASVSRWENGKAVNGSDSSKQLLANVTSLKFQITTFKIQTISKIEKLNDPNLLVSVLISNSGCARFEVWSLIIIGDLRFGDWNFNDNIINMV